MLSLATTTTRELEMLVEQKVVRAAKAQEVPPLINENEMLRKNFATRTMTIWGTF